MLNRGAVVIFAILSLGVVMASFAVWYQARISRRCLELWGVEGANLIRHAPRVEGLRIAASETEDIEPRGGGQGEQALHQSDDSEPALSVAARVDMSKARGLVHARHALIVDYNYDPLADSPPATRHWQYMLRFTEADRQVELLLDPDSRFARIRPAGNEQRLRGETMRAVVAFIERELSAVERDQRWKALPTGTDSPGAPAQ